MSLFHYGVLLIIFMKLQLCMKDAVSQLAAVAFGVCILLFTITIKLF